MDTPLTKLTAFAISLILSALIIKSLNPSESQVHAFTGGSILFFIVAVIIGKVFRLKIIPSLLFSSIIVGLIMFFISPLFTLIMVVVFFIFLLIIVLAYFEAY